MKSVRAYDVLFVGGGLAALLLLQELRTVLPDRVAVIDPCPLIERSPVHWSHEQTPYDRFAPPRTKGPRHILLGTKRGLIKPSAGYGIVRIARESKHLARLWRENRPLPPSWRSLWQWRILDKGFLQLAAQDPRLPLALLHRVMGTIPLSQSLRSIDEELPLGELAPLLRSASPVVLGRS